jgi:hypothetical protein
MTFQPSPEELKDSTILLQKEEIDRLKKKIERIEGHTQPPHELKLLFVGLCITGVILFLLLLLGALALGVVTVWGAVI